MAGHVLHRTGCALGGARISAAARVPCSGSSDFDIENGMAGPSGRLSGRRTYVGLLNEHWSMFATGRQSNAMQKTLVPLYIATALGRDVHHPFDTDDLDSTFLTNNSIQYQTPDWVA